MRILLIGHTGQVGTALKAILPQQNLILATRRPQTPRVIAIDLSENGSIERGLGQSQADCIINAAAYTQVDAAEQASDAAFQLNAEAPACIARWCSKNAAQLVHFSTDYVFDGSHTVPYREVDSPAAKSVYGASKLAGEQAIQQALVQHLILRTSWVYAATGKNFLLTMLRLAKEHPELRIVDDQVGKPTWAGSIAMAVTAMLQSAKLPGFSGWGVYHYADQTALSWFAFAQRIFTLANRCGLLSKTPKLVPISTAELGLAAARPAYSVLSTEAVCNTFGEVRPMSLNAALTACFNELQTGCSK